MSHKIASLTHAMHGRYHQLIHEAAQIDCWNGRVVMVGLSDCYGFLLCPFLPLCDSLVGSWAGPDKLMWKECRLKWHCGQGCGGCDLTSIESDSYSRSYLKFGWDRDHLSQNRDDSYPSVPADYNLSGPLIRIKSQVSTSVIDSRLFHFSMFSAASVILLHIF